MSSWLPDGEAVESDLVQPPRPNRLALPGKGLLPPPGHDRCASALSGCAPGRTARRATLAHRRCAVTTSGTPRRSRCSSGWSASASDSHRPCRAHTRSHHGVYRTTRTAVPVRRAAHRRQPNAASPATAPPIRQAAAGTPSFSPTACRPPVPRTATPAQDASSTPHMPARSCGSGAFSSTSASARAPRRRAPAGSCATARTTAIPSLPARSGLLRQISDEVVSPCRRAVRSGPGRGVTPPRSRVRRSGWAFSQ